MVDAIGSGIGKVAVSPPARVARVEGPQPAASPSSSAVPAETVARRLSAEPPVDAERVRRIRAAVESGEFPISPAKIADRLIALKYEWMQHDEA